MFLTKAAGVARANEFARAIYVSRAIYVARANEFARVRWTRVAGQRMALTILITELEL